MRLRLRGVPFLLFRRFLLQPQFLTGLGTVLTEEFGNPVMPERSSKVISTSECRHHRLRVLNPSVTISRYRETPHLPAVANRREIRRRQHEQLPGFVLTETQQVQS